jgi:glycosyltransferase involved in cell wall biosynthesis
VTRRLRVLHVGKFYPPHPGGMESHLGFLAGRLRDSGEADVEVVVSNASSDTVSEVIDGIPVTRVGTRLAVAGASFNPGMARAIRERAADVVHFHHPNPTAVVSYLASGHPGRLVVTYHSDIVRQRVLAALLGPLLDRFFRRASAILATSPNYAATSPVLRRHAERVRVVPFGIDAEGFADAPAEAAEVRARYGPRIVLAVGRLVYYKGFDYLLRAFARVDGRLLIVGSGPLRKELEAEAERLGVADRVAFLGSVPDLRPYYHAADVFAFPSVARSEAFGLAQLEAMASGLPVVNTALESGVPFVSPHGLSGLTVPPRDAAVLAGAVSRLLDDPALRRRLGGAGRERARTTLSAGAMVERTLQVYRAAAEARVPPVFDS